MTDKTSAGSSNPVVLPCPFCGGPAGQALWPNHYGCINTECGAYAANLALEQWNRRAGFETSAWQPIETAPKDGSRILAYFDYNPIYRESSERWFVAVVRWTGDYGMWSMPGIGGLSPKLWQPIRYPNDPTLKAAASPADLVGALQDVVHTDTGQVRAARAVKANQVLDSIAPNMHCPVCDQWFWLDKFDGHKCIPTPSNGPA